jgi:hypothetical protein
MFVARFIALLALLCVASSAAASGPPPADQYRDRVIAVADDGTVLTEGTVDSLLAAYPTSVRNAFKRIGLLWHGNRRVMTFAELAAYCGPVVWLSPDEPLLEGAEGKDVHLPTGFPFEAEPDGPVVYYRVRSVLERPGLDEGAAIVDVDPARRTTGIDLSRVVAIDLDYFFFYPSEEGLGAHKYDVESVELKLLVAYAQKYPELGWWITVDRVVAKAHGVLWYDNNLEVDRHTRLPLHIMQEEGKHASCTDKNGDGLYTPGYDVNVRVNDAWGVRDVMATGSLYSGGFQAWMAKQRRPEHRVLPPLPEDSPLRERFTTDGVYAPDNAVYELRPFPKVAPAVAFDPALERFVDKGDENWPEVTEYDEGEKFARWLDTDAFAKSVSLAFRYDGQPGLSVVFPLLVVKNVADPVGGGWLVNRVYVKDHKLRDLSWNLLYTTSASRWIDGYFAVGWEWDDTGSSIHTNAMTEAGLKLRFNMSQSPLRFLAKATDFWGVRIGVKNLGIWEWNHIGYAVEVGAGAF